LLAGCSLGTFALDAVATSGGPADAAPATVVLHYYQKGGAPTFFNATDQVMQGYPPVGGHVREDDVDYVGNHAHHAKTSTVTDHLYCNVVTAPATAACFTEFAVGSSLIYVDNATVNLASGAGTLPVDGGTGQYAGYTGSAASTTIGNSNNSDIVITLHKR
jgi:hypothetical protein